MSDLISHISNIISHITMSHWTLLLNIINIPGRLKNASESYTDMNIGDIHISKIISYKI